MAKKVKTPGRKNQSKITKGAAILAVSSFFSYAFGLLRDRLLAGKFGAGESLDVYQASFLIPDLVLNIFLAGALASAIVPVLSDLLQSKEKKELNDTVSFLINAVLIIISIISLVCFILMPWLVLITAPGFVGEKRELLIATSRIMLLSPVIFGLSNLLGGVLISYKKFVAYSFSPVLYNAGIIVGILFLADRYGVIGVAYGTVFGALLHLSIRLVSVIRSKMRYRFITKPVPKPAVRSLKLMLPRILGLIAWQGNLWVFTFVGSTLQEGSVGIFNLARNFQSLPVSLIGISLATAVFPFLSSDFAKKREKSFMSDFIHSFKKIIFLTLPASFALALLSTSIISLFLGTGKFSAEAVAVTAGVLAIFSFVVPFESVNHLLSRTYYARHNTLVPVIISFGAMGINIALCFALTRYMGIYGLPLAFLIASIVQTFTLVIVLNKAFIRLHLSKMLGYTLRVLVPTISMAGVIAVILNYFPLRDTLLSRFFQLSTASILGFSIYLIIAYVLKIEEVHYVVAYIKKWQRKFVSQ
ncbi:murein biosynthesis integral membrane protein MurJ [Patescibacteria group bacterium]|nr:murein biosynthesis integral membrane protein MurJ [Patescibacteria group bacterium]